MEYYANRPLTPLIITYIRISNVLFNEYPPEPMPTPKYTPVRRRPSIISAE
jgi:hypothetical protein